MVGLLSHAICISCIIYSSWATHEPSCASKDTLDINILTEARKGDQK